MNKPNSSWPSDYLVPGVRPYFQEEFGMIYHGNCHDLLPYLPEADLLLADPPYLVSAGEGGGCFGKRESLKRTGGFTDSGVDYKFLEGSRNWFCFCSKRQLASLLLLAMANDDSFHVLTWNKTNPLPTCSGKYLPDIEFIVHSFSRGRLFGEMSDKSSYFLYRVGDKATEHPNEKPLYLIKKLVILGSKEGEVIIDPFLGSGTTAVAAREMGRRYVGIEIEEKYCEVAARRLGLASPAGTACSGLLF